jgi:hypothetical protein
MREMELEAAGKIPSLHTGSFEEMHALSIAFCRTLDRTA